MRKETEEKKRKEEEERKRKEEDERKRKAAERSHSSHLDRRSKDGSLRPLMGHIPKPPYVRPYDAAGPSRPYNASGSSRPGEDISNQAAVFESAIPANTLLN